MKPSIGRIVHVFADPAQNNGADIAPAVITRVWDDHKINVHVLPDANAARTVTSIPLFDSREDAAADHLRRQEAAQTSIAQPFAAFWPERV